MNKVFYLKLKTRLSDMFSAKLSWQIICETCKDSEQKGWAQLCCWKWSGTGLKMKSFSFFYSSPLTEPYIVIIIDISAL